MTYNELNFPSFEIDLELWQLGVLRKWKPEDDWEWWWVVVNDDIPLLLPKLDMVITLYDYLNGWEDKFFAIPCLSLGEMVNKLAEKGFCVYKKPNGDWSIGTFILNNSIPMITKNTAANAAAKGVLEVEK